MSGSKQLVFDSTDVDTIAASDSVGAFVRASDGTLIDKRSVNSVNRLAVDTTLNDGAGNALTSTLNGAKRALDVNITNAISTTTDFSYLEDAPHTSGDKGALILAVRNDTPGSMVSADGDYTALQTDSTGALRVSGTFSANSQDNKAEDAAHISGDTGSYVLAVRQDVLSISTSASGDYQSIKGDKWGRTWVNESHQDWKVNKISVVSAGGQILTTPLSGRKRVYIQNKDKKPIYIKESNTAITDGIEVASNSGWLELLLNENCIIYAQSVSATADVRIIEMA